MKRPIKPLKLPGLVPATELGGEPRFEWIDPRRLVVDESYQRGLSPRSVKLISKIVTRWSWAKFKPPIVVETPEGLEVVDGQHTAIGAATLSIPKIPVMIVDAATLEVRAGAFLAHNADRIAATPLQMHHAAVMAKDDDAVTIAQVCERAGVRVPRHLPATKVADCVAVSTIRTLIDRRGAMGARKVLEISAKARSAPIAAAEIRAIDLLMFGDTYKGLNTPEEITTALIAIGPAREEKARTFASSHNVRVWQAMAVIISRRCESDRRRTA